jgi:uncharacterized glyoxalase superfamily protein PhnB
MLYVPDVPTTVRFYEAAVGATCDHAHEDGSYAELRLGPLTLGLVQADFAARHFPGEFRKDRSSDLPFPFEIYMEGDELDQAISRAVAAGATRLGEAEERPWGQRNAFVRDPNGVVVELARPVPSVRCGCSGRRRS